MIHLVLSSRGSNQSWLSSMKRTTFLKSRHRRFKYSISGGAKADKSSATTVCPLSLPPAPNLSTKTPYFRGQTREIANLSTKTRHFGGQTRQNPNLSTKNAKSVDEIPDQVGDDGKTATCPPKKPKRWKGWKNLLYL
ncbi:MAG: hypothetical protein IJK44_02695 [Bacteroidales bacterium]|nr:hypothetical protein [Bacteroidales bacterium]